MIGAIESTIFTNQQTATVASDKNAMQNRLDLQNSIASDSANDKNKEIQEIRPTEENQEVNEDAKQQQNGNDSKKNKKDTKDKNSEDNEKTPLRHLDIKV